MRVLIYAHLFPPSQSGMALANLIHSKMIHGLGHEVRVVACHSTGCEQFAARLDFPVYFLPKWSFVPMSSLSGPGLLSWVFIPLYFLTLKQNIRSFKPDVVLLADETANFYWGIWCTRIRVPCLSVCSVPFLVDTREPFAKDPVAGIRRAIRTQVQACLLKSYDNSKFLLTVSNATGNAIKEAVPHLAPKIRVVPHSIDSRFFDEPVNNLVTNRLKKQYGVGPEDVLLICVARLTGSKGIEDTIRAIACLNIEKRSKLKFLIVGKGSEENHLRRLVDQKDLAKSVILAGEIRNENLIHYYDMSDLFVMPSHSESFGLVFVEAAARSKPAIGVRLGGMIDIIEHNKTGFLIAKGDIEALNRTILWCLANPDGLHEMGRQARNKARREFSYNTVARELENYLQKVAEPNGIQSQFAAAIGPLDFVSSNIDKR